MATSKNALILGATGLVGHELLYEILRDDYYAHVTIFVRTKLDLDHPILNQVIVEDFDELDQYDDYFNADDVYCCLGTTIKQAQSKQQFARVDYTYVLQAARLAKTHGASQFLVVSAIGANRNAMAFYSRVKGELEDALRLVDLYAVHVFRPSLLIGQREEKRIGEKIAVTAAPLFAPLMVGPLKKYRPISVKTLAKAVYTVAQQQQSGYQVHTYEQLPS